MSCLGRIFVPLLLAAIVGCATRRAATPPPVAATPTTRTIDPKSLLTLEQIEPKVDPLPAPATQPTEPAPLKAIELYARGRAALLDGRRFGAISLLKEAVAVDPDSAELRLALARALLGQAGYNDDSIASLEKAAALAPGSLDVQLELGRQYWIKNELPKALATLRRAMLTEGYAEADDRAVLVDMYLAETLQLSGYDRAALDRYHSLLARTRSAGPELRGNPEVAYYIAHPDSIWLKIGALHERAGRHAEALAAYEEAAQGDADNFELQVRIVRMLNELRRPEACERATQVVKAFDARSEAVTLLRETHRAAGNEAGAVDVLRQLHKEDPEDRLVFYALADVLQQLGRRAEARELLASRLKQNRYDVDLIDRLLKLHELDGDWQGGARLLIDASAARPELVSRLSGQWSRLIRPVARRRVQLRDVLALSIPKDREGARQFWVATLANATNRAPLGKIATEQSLAAKPPYHPAYRGALVDALAADEADPKAGAVKTLLDRAAAHPALAAELQGLVQLQTKQPAQAEAMFRRAAELGTRSPVLQDALADALLAQNKDTEAEKVLWATISDWPDYEPAYLQLVGFYSERKREEQMVKVLETWLGNDPASVTARILQANFLIGTRRPDAADAVLFMLIGDRPDNADVLMQVSAMYAQQGRLDVLAARLSDLYGKQPMNRDLLERLVDVQIENKRRPEAMRLVDNARQTFASDADALYHLSGLYQRLELKDTAEEVLQQALRVDPKHAGAANDLGYGWVDAGRNLDQAEQLVRTAVAGEPDNQAFLDSLGWVLYKRSQFKEAVQYLQAAAEGPRPDPVVLDHLADTMYRLGDVAKARATWEAAAKRVEQTGTQRDDLRKLKLELTNKLKQVKDGNPVTVAPVIEAPGPAKAEGESRGPSYGSKQESSNGRP